MKYGFRRRYPMLVAGLALMAAGPVAAGDSQKAKRLNEAGEILPLENILDKSAKLYPDGHIIEIEFDEEAGRYIYEVETVDPQGVVWELEFDARTGEVLKRSQDD